MASVKNENENTFVTRALNCRRDTKYNSGFVNAYRLIS